jgi:hypothetical protein
MSLFYGEFFKKKLIGRTRCVQVGAARQANAGGGSNGHCAQVLKVDHTVDDTVTHEMLGVDSKVTSIDDRVAGVDDSEGHL